MSKIFENMDIDQADHEETAYISENTADEADWIEFSFCKLNEIHCMDFEGISTTAKILKSFVIVEKFYKNFNNCLGYTFEFALTFSSFLIKNTDGSTALSLLLDLLQEIVCRINAGGRYLSPNDLNRILVLLNKLMDSLQKNDVKLAGGKIAIGIIQMQNAALCDQKNFCKLASRLCTFYEEQDHSIELCRLLNAVLKNAALEKSVIIKWLETSCSDHLNQDTDLQLLEQLLECILSYYNTRPENHCVTNTLKGSLQHLCIFMSRPLLRKSTEQLLTILLEELYCTDTLIWPGGASAILNQIKILPDSYEEWPNIDESIFFVVAYLLFLHSQLLWDHTIIWKSLNHYLKTHIFPQRLIIKAVSMLYPVVVNDNPMLTTSTSNKILLDILGTCRSLPELLTYHPIQMTWLLTNAKPSLKHLALVSWLRIQNEDEQILKAIDATKTGSLLVKFLVCYPDASITARVSQLTAKLTSESNLRKTIGLALPLICNRPTVFSQLLQVKPTIPTDPIELLDLIKAASASLPFLTQDAAIQATCSYSVRLLTTMKESNALLMFCHYSASIRFLIAKSTDENDNTALATISLLIRLVKNQIQHNVKLNSSAVVHFHTMLQGNFQRILAGLKLLKVLLSSKNQLFLNIPQQSLLSLYHSVHVFIKHQETAKTALKVLTWLILLENNLAFSLVTPHTLSLVCKKYITEQNMALLEFLATWLNCIIQYSYVEIPVDDVRYFLNQIGSPNDICRHIRQQLNNYEQSQHQE